MPGALRLPAFGRAQLPAWEYLGGEAITMDGASHYGATIPSTTSIVEIRARDGECYFCINGAAASAGSPGYVPLNGAEIIGPLSNLVSLRVFSATANAVAHIMYFVEK